MNNSKTYEYKNDFLYFILSPYKGGENNAMIYCSAVDLYRFLPITKGRHRPMANPVSRGLQLVNLGVRALALNNGATPVAIKEDTCAGILPMRDGLYKERLLIENAPASLPQEIINFCIPDLLRKISNSSLVDCNLPGALPEPDELQKFIEDLCRKYGK